MSYWLSWIAGRCEDNEAPYDKLSLCLSHCPLHRSPNTRRRSEPVTTTWVIRAKRYSNTVLTRSTGNYQIWKRLSQDASNCNCLQQRTLLLETWIPWDFSPCTTVLQSAFSCCKEQKTSMNFATNVCFVFWQFKGWQAGVAALDHFAIIWNIVITKESGPVFGGTLRIGMFAWDHCCALDDTRLHYRSLRFSQNGIADENGTRQPTLAQFSGGLRHAIHGMSAFRSKNIFYWSTTRRTL